MKISVLTVCRNAERTIERTVASFLQQDHPDKEMIILDGASTDATLDMVRRFEDPQVRVVSEPDRGMYDALNKGLRMFAGDAVGCLNADDRFHDSRALSHIADALAVSDAVHGDLDFLNAQGIVARRWTCRSRPAKGFASGWMPAHPTFYVRRHVAEAVGDFDLSYQTAADYDWMMRAVDVLGFRPHHIPHVLVDMALGGRSTSGIGAHIRHNLEALAARRRWLNAGLIDWALIAKPASKLHQFTTLRGGLR